MGRLDCPVSPLAYVQAVFNPWVALGVSLLMLWLFSHMALLSWADLSYVLPVTSIGYVLSALAGKLFLHESITGWRWAGIVLIVAGVLLVARTAPHRSGARHREMAAGGHHRRGHHRLATCCKPRP